MAPLPLRALTLLPMRLLAPLLLRAPDVSRIYLQGGVKSVSKEERNGRSKEEEIGEHGRRYL